MHADTMVTTYTVTSSSYPYHPGHADPRCGGTWSISSRVRETLASALEHVEAMGEAEYPHVPTIVGGTVRRPSLRYVWESATAGGTRAHDMVIIVPDQH